MSFFQNLTNTVSNLMKQAVTPTSPYEVQEINPQTFSRMSVVSTEGQISLLKDVQQFVCIMKNIQQPNKGFCLFRLKVEMEAMTLFSNLSFKLQPLLSSSARMAAKDVLQLASDTLRERPTFSSAHLAVKLGFLESLRHPGIAENLNTLDEQSRMLPIMVAIEAENMACIKELLILGVHLNVADSEGNNVFHFAAKCANPSIIQFLASKDKSALNNVNVYGENALHTACLHDQPQNVEQLLRWGSDPTCTMSLRFPIHCAMKANSVRCVETLCRWNKTLVHIQDKKYGGTALHWAKSRECVYLLADLGCNLDAENEAGETALHIMVQRNRQPCVMALLAKGARAELEGAGGNNALHMAILTDNSDLVQMLIVFGTDVDQKNHHQHTPRHLAATSSGLNRDKILFLLHAVGAMRCAPGQTGCSAGCAEGGNHNGTPPNGSLPSTPDHQKQALDHVVSELAMTAAMTRSNSASGSSIMGGDVFAGSMGCSGDRVLCLDGGGIRGLILIQILLALERVLGQPIRTCFDWIGGTSTGGILALGLVNGKSVRYMQGLYFQLKDEVFCGKRPYPSEPLEQLLKKQFGETTKMTEVTFPRVIVTGVLADRNPAELHLFRNYEYPDVDHSCQRAKGSSKGVFHVPLRPHEELLWRAARCSGAAPTYFRAYQQYLDGGVISNNPTLDVMTEIHEYNVRLRATSKVQEARPLHVVVSLGTGRLPVKPVDAVDVYRPDGIFDLYKVVSGAKNLGEMLVEQCTQSEGQVVQRARAWCSMIGVPYYRFSPPLSEDVKLDCRQDQELVNMLWETQCYLHQHADRLTQLAGLLLS